ncbi:putative ribonuclease H-like domain-containing protein, partial [Tanacetum coccineum]
MPLTPNLSFTGLDEFVNKPVVENRKSDEEVSKVVRKSNDSPIIEDWVSDSEEENVSQTKTEKKTVKPSIAKIEFVKPKQQEKTARKTVKQVEKHRQNTHSPRGNQRNWNNMMSQRLGSNFEMFNKACYVCGSFDHLQVDCNYHHKQFQKQRMVKPVWNNAQRVNHQNFAKKTHSCAKKNMVPRAVLMKSGLVSINTARQVNAAHTKTTVNAARPMSYLSKKAHSTVKRPIHKNTTFKNSNFNQRVNTVKDKNVNTVRPKAVVNVVKGNNVNAVKASACWGNPQMDLQDQGVIDSGCSRHMIGNMSYLTNYEEIDGGYVAFGGNPKGGKITRKATKDETSGILKSFITWIENLVDHKVKVIRCDNGTEFKNKEMNQFCEMKGILRQYSVARTPQQNKIAESRNKTLIEAARTMLVDSKLPTTFWAEAVNTACYVQNRVQYIDGKADEGFFVRYSLNSKAFRVFNSRTRIVEENLHIRFSESTLNVVGSGPDWLFYIDALTRTMNYEPIDDGSKPSSDDGKKVDEDSRKDSEGIDQENEDNVNSTNNVNAASTNKVNAVGRKTSIELPLDPNMPELEDYSTFKDDEDVGAEADMYNLDTTIQISPILTTRIHKDHPLDQVIRDLQSATQTRRMLKSLEEHGFVSTIQQRTNHKDLSKTSVYCFFSKGRTKKSFIKREKLTEPCLSKDTKVRFCWSKVGWDDIIFGSRKKELCNAFEKFIEVKTTSTPMETQKPLLKDEDAYTDSDYAGASLDRKSTTGGYQFLGCRLISWQCKKQTVVANSKEAEYVDDFSCLDGKKIIITESIVRRDFQLEDAEGVDCLPNATIFEQLALIGKPKRKDTQIPQSSGPTEHVADEAVYKELDDSLVRAITTASSLETEQDSGNINKTRSKATPNEASSQGTTLGGSPRCQETMGDTIAQTRFENVSKLSNDQLLARGNILQSGEDSLKLIELIELCTNLQTRVLDLEKTKTTQAKEI